MLSLQGAIVLSAWAVSAASADRDTQPKSAILFSQISSGVNHTCALASDGTAYCWGLNNSGEATPLASYVVFLHGSEFRGFRSVGFRSLAPRSEVAGDRCDLAGRSRSEDRET